MRALLAAVPVEPGRDQARLWARVELAHAEYQAHRPGLLDRALAWLHDLLGRASGHGADAATGLLVLATLAVVLVVAVVLKGRQGVGRTRAARDRAVLADPTRTAAEHHADADAAERAGDFAAAVTARFRALVRDLEERAVLPVRTGRTAQEAAGEVAARLHTPDDAAAVASAAAVFDAVRYGGAPAAAGDAALVRAAAARTAALRAVAVPT